MKLRKLLLTIGCLGIVWLIVINVEIKALNLLMLTKHYRKAGYRIEVVNVG